MASKFRTIEKGVRQLFNDNRDRCLCSLGRNWLAKVQEVFEKSGVHPVVAIVALAAFEQGRGAIRVTRDGGLQVGMTVFPVVDPDSVHEQWQLCVDVEQFLDAVDALLDS